MLPVFVILLIFCQFKISCWAQPVLLRPNVSIAQFSDRVDMGSLFDLLNDTISDTGTFYALEIRVQNQTGPHTLGLNLPFSSYLSPTFQLTDQNGDEVASSLTHSIRVRGWFDDLRQALGALTMTTGKAHPEHIWVSLWEDNFTAPILDSNISALVYVTIPTATTPQSVLPAIIGALSAAVAILSLFIVALVTLIFARCCRSCKKRSKT